MALDMYFRADRWASAYRPIVYQYKSDLYPGVGSFTIIQIRRPTATELTLYPQLSKSSVLVYHTPTSPSAFYAGSSIRIYNTAAGLYKGVFKVRERIGQSVTVIDTPDGWVGDDSGGVFAIHLNRFTVFVQVTSENMAEPVIMRVTPTDAGTDGIVFQVDVRDVLARHFKDIKEIINVDSDASIPSQGFVKADGYITQTYGLKAWEGYEVVDEDGSVTFTEFPTVGPYTLNDQIAVNSVQPYHEMRRDGTVRLGWDDGLQGYVMKQTGTARLLTHAGQTGQFVSTSDAHYMAYLWGGSENDDITFRVSFYTGMDGGGSFISTESYTGTTGKRSGIVAMGPANITIPGTAKSYKFAMANSTGNLLVSEVFTFNVVDCKGSNKRFFYLNKMGGVDAFTFQGDEARSLNVSREIIAKPNMNTLPGFFNGDWQRRVWRTSIDNRYIITSDYLTPSQIRTYVEPLMSSANVWTSNTSDYWTPVIVFTGTVPLDSSSERKERVVMEYGYGVDNVTQRT